MRPDLSTLTQRCGHPISAAYPDRWGIAICSDCEKGKGRGGKGGGAIEADSPRNSSPEGEKQSGPRNSRERVANPAHAPIRLPLTFVLSGQLPGGKNAVRTTRDGQRYPNQRFVVWRDEAMRQLMRQIPAGMPPLAVPLRLRVNYTPSNWRIRDVAGMLDAIGHLLERAGIIKSDGLLRDVLWYQQRGRTKTGLTILGLLKW